MYFVQAFSTQNYILFKISAWGLFLKCSKYFANFSLDVLRKYILVKKERNPSQISLRPPPALKPEYQTLLRVANYLRRRSTHVPNRTDELSTEK